MLSGQTSSRFLGGEVTEVLGLNPGFFALRKRNFMVDVAKCDRWVPLSLAWLDGMGPAFWATIASGEVLRPSKALIQPWPGRTAVPKR